MTEQDLLARRSLVAEKLAKQLRRARLQAGLFQTELAQVIGVDVRTVERWESGFNMSQIVAYELAICLCRARADRLKRRLSDTKS